MVNNKENILNHFYSELVRLKNLGLEGFEPIEFKNSFPLGMAHDLWEMIIEKEADKIDAFFKFDDFLRKHNLTRIRKNELDNAYHSSEERKIMGIKNGVDYRNSLLNFRKEIEEYNLICESKEQEIEKITEENHLKLLLLEKNQELTKTKAEIANQQKLLEEKDKKISELEERVEIEVQTNLEALDKSEEWHKKKVFDLIMEKDNFIFDQQMMIEKLRKDLEIKDEKLANLSKPKKFQELRNLANTTKKKVNVMKERVKEKFNVYILQKNK